MQNPRTTPSERKACEPEEKGRKYNIKNSGQYVHAATPKGST
jgi:hypothetical protein